MGGLAPGQNDQDRSGVYGVSGLKMPKGKKRGGGRGGWFGFGEKY